MRLIQYRKPFANEHNELWAVQVVFKRADLRFHGYADCPNDFINIRTKAEILIGRAFCLSIDLLYSRTTKKKKQNWYSTVDISLK